MTDQYRSSGSGHGAPSPAPTAPAPTAGDWTLNLRAILLVLGGAILVLSPVKSLQVDFLAPRVGFFELLTAPFLALLLLEAVLGRRQRVPAPLLRIWVCLAFIVAAMLAAALLSGSYGGWFVTANSSVLFIIASYVVLTARSPRWEWTVLVPTLSACAMAWFHQLGIIPAYDQRLYTLMGGAFKDSPYFFDIGYVGLITTRGSYGILCLLGLYVTVRRATSVAQTHRLLWWGVGAFIALSMVMSLSRSTWLGLVVFAGLAWTAWVGHRLRIDARVLAAVPLLGLAALGALELSGISNVFGGLMNLRSGSVMTRADQIAEVIRRADEIVLFGAGDIRIANHVVHNLWAAVFVQYGGIALMFWVLAWAMILALLIRTRRICATAAGRYRVDLLTALFLAINVELIAFSGYGSFTMWMALGVITAGAWREARSARAAPAGLASAPADTGR